MNTLHTIKTWTALGLLLMSVGAYAEQRITLVYSGNLNGELEPCGCSEAGNLGGIKRRATIIKQLRQQHPQLVLVSAGGLISSDSGQDRIKGEFILNGLAKLDYDAIGVQWRDLAYGEKFAQQAALPWAVSNWLGAGFEQQQQIERGESKLAFFAWLDPSQSPMQAMAGEHVLVDDDLKSLQRQLAAAKQQGMTTLLASEWPLKKAEKSFDLSLVDVLFVRAGYEVYGEPQKSGNTLVLQAGSRGMRLGTLELILDDNGNLTGWSDHKVLDLPNSVADDPALADWYQAYNDRVKADYEKRVALRKAKESGTSPFVGAQVCQSCHAKAFEAWQASLHAGAYGKLEGVNKAFDPECLQCHTVGFNQEGGFVDMQISEHLLNVQCENCHGAGRAHAQSVGKTATPNKGWPKEQVCGQCHTQPHSPEFKLESYWPRIQHGR